MDEIFLYFQWFSVKMTNTLNVKEYLSKFGLTKIQLNLAFFNAEITFEESDKSAAWELYIEMLTRIVTQPLPSDAGDEKTALDSVYVLFPITREILRSHGRKAIQFSKIAIPVLNQIVRPFTAKWHKEGLAGAFEHQAKRKEFRDELEILQGELRSYNSLLANIASVEDLTDLEENDLVK